MRVAHYVEQWLEISAGFVADQVARSRHRGLVISRDGWLNLEAFPYRPRHGLHQVRQRVPERLKYPVLRVQLGALLTAYRAPVVHVHFGYPARDVLDVVDRRGYVLSLHGHDVTALPRERPGCFDGVTDRVDAVIVPSRFLADRAERAGFPAERIVVIPSGVDTAFFTPSPLPDQPVVGFVGRLVEKKGLDVLMAAWPLIHSAMPDAGLVVLGDGPLAALVDGADPSVRRLRPDTARRADQVRDVIRGSRVVVTPSRTAANGDSESLLLVNLEAAASGRPVVSTRHGGIPEYVDDGATGLLVEEGDHVALAEAVLRVLRDAPLAARLGEAGVRRAAPLDAQSCAARIDDLYDGVLAARPR
jgi:glycosyltransferase involved in cell wall biosynthesis